jgi:hypothetical protein
MSTHSSHQTEIPRSELLGAFVLGFWPVSLIAALLESPFFDGYQTLPINLALGSLAGLIAVKKYRAYVRRQDSAM